MYTISHVESDFYILGFGHWKMVYQISWTSWKTQAKLTVLKYLHWIADFQDIQKLELIISTDWIIPKFTGCYKGKY